MAGLGDGAMLPNAGGGVGMFNLSEDQLQRLQELASRFGSATKADERYARGIGLLAAGLGVLGTRTSNPWVALGQGGLFGLGAQQQVLRDAAASRGEGFQNIGHLLTLQNALAQQRRQGQIDALARNSVRPGAPGMPAMGPPTAQGEVQPPVAPGPTSFDKQAFGTGLWQIDPQKALAFEQAMAKENPLDKFKPGDYTPESVAEFQKTNDPSKLKFKPPEKPLENWIDVGKTADGQIIQREASTNQLRAVGSPAQRTTVNLPPMESEYDKSLGKSRAEAFMNLQKGGQTALGKLQNLDTIDALVKNVETSPLTPIGMKISGTVQGLTGIKLDPELPQKQAAESVIGKMVLEARSAGVDGQVGMPGNMSNADREFLIGMTPNLSQTAEGRRLTVEVQRRLRKREIETAQMAREYQMKNKRFDEGFTEVMKQYAKAHPMFSDLQGKLGGPSVRQRADAIISGQGR